MAGKKWTDDEVAAEIREAVKIVHEDRERQTYQQLHERFGKTEEPPNPQDPPAKGDEDPAPPAPKRSLFWGDALNSDPE